MKSTSTLSLLTTYLITTTSTTLAFPKQPKGDSSTATGPEDPRFTQYAAPGPKDVRSPCPGLNTLANHGFIHRDGRNMTIPHLIEGLAAGYNMGVDFTTAIGGAGILSNPNPAEGAFDLPDLSEHNFPIEHDVSLSRRDAFLGNQQPFYNPNWQTVLSSLKKSKDGLTTLENASAGKYKRLQASQRKNPELVYGPREFVLSYGEVALYLTTMSNDPNNAADGVAKISYVRSLFEKEKLPYEQGWRRSTQPITLVTLGNLALQLSSVSPEPGMEGVQVASDTLQDVFEARDPITGKLLNATGSILDAIL